MQGGDDVPDGVVADNDGEAEGGCHGGEGSVGRADTKAGQAGQATGVDQRLFQLVVEVIGWWWRFFGNWSRKNTIIILILDNEIGIRLNTDQWPLKSGF